MYEWLPFNGGRLEDVPPSPQERRRWLEHRLGQFKAMADRFRGLLVKRYGTDRGEKVKYAEAFEPCEYGAALTEENAQALFPF